MALFEDLGFSKVDTNREKLKGFPEIVYGEHKAPEHILEIVKTLNEKHHRVLVTRFDEEKYQIIQDKLPKGLYDPVARVYSLGENPPLKKGKVLIISAGTADYFVTQEAYLTAKWMGLNVEVLHDLGIAGLGRLLSYTDEMRAADVLVVVAGMEGALPSVVSGLVDTPVIAVPTSVGYGANLEGITTMLAMLTSCSSGISVVNINNGFGAAYQSALIIKLLNKKENDA